jgi:hypothetical protein
MNKHCIIAFLAGWLVLGFFLPPSRLVGMFSSKS